MENRCHNSKTLLTQQWHTSPTIGRCHTTCHWQVPHKGGNNMKIKRWPRSLEWARTYLGEFLTDRPCGFHAELMADLENREKRLIARVAPRGHGKSILAGLAFPLWCICERKRKNIVIITHEQGLATQFVRDIRNELETNEAIIGEYGDLCEEDWGIEPQGQEDRERESGPPAAAGKLRRGDAENSAERRTMNREKAGSAADPAAADSAPAIGRCHTNHRVGNPVIQDTGCKPVPQKEEAENAKREVCATQNLKSTADTAVAHVDRGKVGKWESGNGGPRKSRGKWTEEKFTTATGITVQAKGVGASFRGVRVGAERPDLIICDDIEKDEHVETAEGRAKLEHWLRHVVMPALALGGRLLVLGSMLHWDSLLASLGDRGKWKGWDYRVYRALETINRTAEARRREGGERVERVGNPGKQDTGFKPVPQDAPAVGGCHTSPAIGRCHNSPTDGRCHTSPTDGRCHTSPAIGRCHTSSNKSHSGYRALWEGRWPVERLLEERERIGTRAFEQEYQGRPVDDTTRVFRPEWLQRYDVSELVDERLTTVMAVDPATGASAGDYFALWVGSIDAATGVIYTRELRLARVGIVEQVRMIVEAWERWRPVKIGIETTAYQVALKQVLDDLSRREGRYMVIEGISTTTNKRARIEGSSVFYENGTMRMPAVLSAEVEAQFLHYPRGSHDDAPDVCAMGIEVARAMRGRSGKIEVMTPSMRAAQLGAHERWMELRGEAARAAGSDANGGGIYWDETRADNRREGW